VGPFKYGVVWSILTDGERALALVELAAAARALNDVKANRERE
jgi:hypothetical protein